MARLTIGAARNAGAPLVSDLYVADSQGGNVFHMDGNNAFLTIGAGGNAGNIVMRDGG